MSYSGFGRGRGYGPRGTRAKGPFSRPYPRSPFRGHGGPPRPGHPALLAAWQPKNGFYHPQLLRGNPQFRPGGRRRFNVYDVRYANPKRLPVPPGCEEVTTSTSCSPQVENDQIDGEPQSLPLGSEEERRQKIIKTADQLKQKLSCFNNGEVTNIWNDDVSIPSNTVEDGCIESKGIPELRYEPPELSLTYSDLKDIGRINNDNIKIDNLQHMTDLCVSDKEEDGPQLEVISSIQAKSVKQSDLKNLPNKSGITKVKEQDTSIDNLHNVRQIDLHKDDIVENVLLQTEKTDKIFESNIAQYQCDRKQGISQKINPVIEQDRLNVHNIPLPTKILDQSFVQKDISQNGKETITNLKVHKNALNSQVHTNISALNNVALANQVSKIQENSSLNKAPELSLHTEQELPLDFDPSTPPPILLKQDRVCTLPPRHDLLPLFDPTAPPPNMRHLFESTIFDENTHSARTFNANIANITPYKASASFNNREVHTELYTHAALTSQQSPLEISNQNNVSLLPHTDVNFSSFSVPSSSDSGINNFPSARTQNVHHNVYLSSIQESSVNVELPNSHCNVDMLDDMQGATRCNKQMTNITERKDKVSKSNSEFLPETLIKHTNDVNAKTMSTELKARNIKSKKVKKDNSYSKKSIHKERETSNHLSLEETIQDAVSKSKNVSLDEPDRPKVIFNLNNKMKKVNTKAAWQKDNNKTKHEERNGMTRIVISEDTYIAPSITSKDLDENKPRQNAKEETISKKTKNSLKNMTSTEPNIRQGVTFPDRRIQKSVHVERSQQSGVPLHQKVNLQKSPSSHMEKGKGITSEASWKDKIINRFLNMSKIDIFNTVNNTSLRKFDIIMKHLVKEKRSALSLEMRHAQDEKLYDQQEFLTQLNAMLDPLATVAITDLPTEFIRHLNEVLQLDILPSDQVELEPSSSNQCCYSEGANDKLSPDTCIAERADGTAISNDDVNQSCIRNHMIETEHEKDMQAHNMKTNDLNLKEDTCSTIVSNRSSASSKLSSLQHDLDDIFSEVKRKNQVSVATTRKGAAQDAKKCDNGTNLRKLGPLEDDRTYRSSENCARWVEKCDKWKKKEQEDPYAYRNLTKEEWEAKYGTSEISSSPISKKVGSGDEINSSSRPRTRSSIPQRRHSSESLKRSNAKHKTIETDKFKQSRRHSNTGRYSAEYSEHNNDQNSSSDSSSSSSSSSSNSSSSTTSDSKDEREQNVTKLLRMIKEREKVAKKMSLNETIRDEVNAEIMRQRKEKAMKSHKNRKSAKWRKKKKTCYKRNNKQCERLVGTSDSFSKEDNDRKETSKLLEQDKIKKEDVENQITQEVIIKEELDINQEENISGSEFANVPSYMKMENKVTSLLPIPCDKLESPLTEDTPATTNNTVQLQVEDKPLVSSPTQPKTKAQLKQMPEIADTDNNKISQNISSNIPENRDIAVPPRVSEFSENLDNYYQTVEINYDQSQHEVPSAITKLISQSDVADSSTMISHDGSNENSTSQALNATICTSTEPLVNAIGVHGSSESLVAADISSKASSVSDNPTITPKQTYKKIDIKTYYKRTIQRRMNEHRESNRLTEDTAMETQDLLSMTKSTDAGTVINKSISVRMHDEPIQNPELIPSARLSVAPCLIAGKDNIADQTLRNSIRQEVKETVEESDCTESTLKHDEGNSDSKSAVKQTNKSISEDEASLTTNTNVNVFPNVTTRTTPPKKYSKSKANTTDKESSDRSRFKNIRSEGSKELKLKKETGKMPKTKKMSTKVLNSVKLVSTKICHPSAEIISLENNTQETSQRNESGDTGDINKTEVERTIQSLDPCINKVNNNSTKAELSKDFSNNSGNKTSDVTRNVDQAKEFSSNPELIKSQGVNRDKELVSENAHKHLSSDVTHEGKAHNMKDHMKSVKITDEENYNVGQTSNASESLVLETVPKIIFAAETSSVTGEIRKENQIQQRNDTKNKESSSVVDVNRSLCAESVEENAKQSNNQDLSANDRDFIEENHGIKDITELDIIPRLNDIGIQGNERHLLINIGNIETDEANQNNMESNNLLDNVYKSANINEDSSSVGKSPISSSMSDENFQAQQSPENISSPGSTGSPFKGFLRKSIITSERSNLLNLALGEIDKNDKIFLDNCNINCLTDATNAVCEEMEIERRQTDDTPLCCRGYANNQNISFADVLLSSDKEFSTKERNDKSDLLVDKNKEKCMQRSPIGIVTTTLHENDDIDAGESNGEENHLKNGEAHTFNAELESRGSTFINESETIQNETRLTDLSNKLSSTADPNLSEALNIVTSNEALTLPESENADQISRHTYLETNTVEKAPRDKLINFGTAEHLENDIFDLDIHSQSNVEFDNKDNVSPYFYVHQENPRYDITPETTAIMHCCDLSCNKPEQPCKLDFNHILSMNDDCNLLSRTTVERTSTVIDAPRILNVPTKAALKEATTNLFLKSANDLSTGQSTVSEKPEENEVDLSNLHYAISKTHTQKIQNNATVVAPHFMNVSTASSMQDDMNDIRIYKNSNITQNKVLTANIEEHFHADVQDNLFVELGKMKELGGITEKRKQDNPKKAKDSVCKQKNVTLHKLKNIQKMKYQPTRKALNIVGNNLVKKMKNMKRSGQVRGMREAVLARMLEIDIEMHKLAVEKLQLHHILQSDVSSIKNTMSTSDTVLEMDAGDTVLEMYTEKDAISTQSDILSGVTSKLAQNTEDSHTELNEHTSKQPPTKQRKMIASDSLEDKEIMHCVRTVTMPAIESTIEREAGLEDELKDDIDERTVQQEPSCAINDNPDDPTAATGNNPGIQEQDAIAVNPDTQAHRASTETENGMNNNNNVSKCRVWLSEDKNDQSQDCADRETEITERCFVHESDNKKDDVSALSETAKASSQTSSTQIHSTPEPLSIYSDDSTWDSLMQKNASEMHEKKRSTGLALLEETFKKELAMSRKMKTVARRMKKKQLNNFLKSVNNLTVEEEELPLSKLYIKKLQQKRDLLDSLSQRKNDASIDPKILENMEEVINAVAENRIEDLYDRHRPTPLSGRRERTYIYDRQAEMQTSNDTPATSNTSSVSQCDKHQFFVDTEANANSDWSSREKKADIEGAALRQQEGNDVLTADRSNSAFVVVNDDKITVCDDRDVEPDSSVTPEETLKENHTINCEQVARKDINNVASRNFDIKVSVPNILITDDFRLGLLQRYKSTGDGVVGTGHVDSTTNTFMNNSEKLEENNEHGKKPQCPPQTVKSSMHEDANDQENVIDTNKCIVNANNCKRKTSTCESQREKTDNAEKSQSGITKFERTDVTKSEDSDNSVASNEYDNIAVTDIALDSNTPKSITKETDTQQKESDVESKLSNDTIVLRENFQDVGSAVITKDEGNNPEKRSSPLFEETSNDQCIRSPTPVNRANVTSEEFSGMSTEERYSLKCTSSSIFSSNKAINRVRNEETLANRKAINRRKLGNSMPVRKSFRYSNENVKPNKMDEVDANSNSGEQELTVLEEVEPCRSRSPTWAIRDERIINTPVNVRKNRAIQKAQNGDDRKILADTEYKVKIENPVKSHLATALEPTSSKNKTGVIVRKRKQCINWQMMNCKVRLIDCKHNIHKLNLNPEVLNRLGITAVNPHLSKDILCTQRTIYDQDIAIIPAAISKKDSLFPDKIYDKDKSEIEIFECKSTNEISDNSVEESAPHVTKTNEQESTRTQYTVHKGPILDIKVFDRSFLAASEDGKIYRYSQTSNGILNIYKGHKSAVTCLHIYKSESAGMNKDLMYSGSLDGTLRCYDIMTGALIKNPAHINSPIQCMDQAWGMIFIGTKSGHVSRFHIKGGVIKGSSIQFSDKSVLALKATNEGPRKILIVASRNQPITIRDAQNGLFLRTICSQKNHTVYSLMRHHNLIYCGTSSTSINIFDFTTGEHTIQYDAGVGIVCMRLYEDLLFAGCYDGNIYVFDTKTHKLVCSIPGPGNMLLSVEVVHNKIIAGSKDKRLHSWQMPVQVHALLEKNNITI